MEERIEIRFADQFRELIVGAEVGGAAEVVFWPAVWSWMGATCCAVATTVNKAMPTNIEEACFITLGNISLHPSQQTCYG